MHNVCDMFIGPVNSTSMSSRIIRKFEDFIFGQQNTSSINDNDTSENRYLSNEDSDCSSISSNSSEGNNNDSLIIYDSNPQLELTLVENLRATSFERVFNPYSFNDSLLQRRFQSYINLDSSSSINLQDSHIIPNMLSNIMSRENSIHFTINLRDSFDQFTPHQYNFSSRLISWNLSDLMHIVRHSRDIRYTNTNHNFFSSFQFNNYTNNLFSDIPWEVLNYNHLLEAAQLRTLSFPIRDSLTETMRNYLNTMNNQSSAELIVHRVTNEFAHLRFQNWININSNLNNRVISPEFYANYFNNTENRLTQRVIDSSLNDSIDSGLDISADFIPLAENVSYLTTAYESIIPSTVRLLDYFLYQF